MLENIDFNIGFTGLKSIDSLTNTCRNISKIEQIPTVSASLACIDNYIYKHNLDIIKDSPIFQIRDEVRSIIEKYKNVFNTYNSFTINNYMPTNYLDNVAHTSFSRSIISNINPILSIMKDNRVLDAYSMLISGVSIQSNIIPNLMDKIDWDEISIDDGGTVHIDQTAITLETLKNEFLDFAVKAKKGIVKNWKRALIFLTAVNTICQAFGTNPRQILDETLKEIQAENLDISDVYYVTTESASIYSQPDTNSSILKEISYGVIVTAEINDEFWIKVTVKSNKQNIEGWIPKCNVEKYI